MLVQADRVFVTAIPLSELVWSPRKGLGLKCADSSSDENRTSLWWSNESFNVIATGPECNGVGEYFDNGMLPKGDVVSSQFGPSSDNKNNIHVTSPPGSIVGIVPACPTMTREQNSDNALEAYCEEVQGMPGRNEISVAEADGKESIPLEQTKTCESSLGNSGRNVDSTSNNTDKVSSQGCTKAKTTGSLSSNPVQMNMDRIKSDKGSLPEYAEYSGKKDTLASNFVEGLALRCNTLGKPSSHLLSVDSKHSGKESDAREEDVNNHVHSQLTYFYHLGNQTSNFDNILHLHDLSFFKSFANCGGEAVVIGIPESSYNIKNETQNAPLLFKSILGTSDNEEEKAKRKKGKEKIDESGEDANVDTNRESNRGFNHSKERDDSPESNSREFSTGKRERCFETKESSRKKLKQINNERTLNGTLLRQDSSFFNWISRFEKALPGSTQVETSTAPVPYLSRIEPKNLCSPFSLNKGGDLPHSSVGSQSFVQILHRPRLKTQQMITSHVNDQHSNLQSSELQIPNKRSVRAGGSAIHISTKLNLHQPVPWTTLRLDQCQAEEMLAPSGTNSISDLQAQGKQQHIGFNKYGLCNLGSSSSSIRIASVDPRIMEAGKPDSVVHSSDVLVVSDGNEFLGSFWITRLCSRPPLSLSGQIKQVVNSATQMLLDGGNMYVPHLQNDIVPFKENKCFENVHISPVEDQKDTMRNEEHSPNHLDSSTKEVTIDKKPKAKLDPILPSKRIKKLEPITSVFAKRLDAFRHIKSSNIVNDVLYSASICFFCGQTGHSMKDCSQVTGTELENLQKNINLYDGPKYSACLCIWCFQLNHWAIACPYSPRKTNSPCGGPPCIAAVNIERVDDQLAIDDSRRSERHQREYPKNLAMHNAGVEEVMSFDPKLVKDLPGEGNFKGKNILPSSVHSEARGNQITPVYSFVKRNMFGEQAQIFERIRGLYLSRTDLARLMRTPISGFDLEGFFLRVRLRKYEEILEGSGYQVACISGVSQEKSLGTEHHIPVNIGGFKFLLDCRFVSNNDFTEDELNAWWSAITRSGGKPPTEEELTRKLQERKRFGI